MNFHDETRIEYLYDEKVNKSPVYDTHNQKIEVMINPRDAEKNLIGFRIYEDKDTIHDFYLIKKTNNYQTIINWKNILSSILIQHDFHFYYEALKKIGKGHFASVIKKKNP